MKNAFRAYRRNQPHHNEVEQTATPFFDKTNDAPGSPFFSKGNGVVQTKLTVGQPDDVYEQEADAVADAVVQNQRATPAIQQKGISRIQRALTSAGAGAGTAEERMKEDQLVQEKREPGIQKMEKPLEEEEAMKAGAIQKMEMPKEEEDPLTAGAVQKMEMPKEEEEKPGSAPAVMTKPDGTQAASPQISQGIESSKGGGSALPDTTRVEMESSIGYDFSGVNIHTGQEAADLNKDLHAQAFTHGQDVYFNEGKYNPETTEGKRLLAHELTHVVQQTSAIESIQRYTDIPVAAQSPTEWGIGTEARVSDIGETVTSNKNRHEAYATSNQIILSNAVLTNLDSGIKLSKGSNVINGSAPDGSGKKTLYEVVPQIKVSSGVPGTPDYWADCGRASREVMGKSGADAEPRGLYVEKTGDLGQTSKSYDPADYRNEIYIKGGLGRTADEARKAYLKLTPKEKDDFDKKYGINKYAAPNVGEAFTSRRDDQSTSKGFNWHWGSVIMVAGHDRVTFENYIKPGLDYDSKDTKWYFETYGPPGKSGQTWHERWEGSVGEKGKNNTTLMASTVDLSGELNQKTKVYFWDATSLTVKNIEVDQATKITTLETRGIVRRIRVTSGPNTGIIGWIPSAYFKGK